MAELDGQVGIVTGGSRGIGLAIAGALSDAGVKVACVARGLEGAVTAANDIEALERSTGLPVISDAACGLGGTDAAGRPGGAAGRMATFSFHPRKLVTTGEGGAIVCDDEALATRLRQIRP